jgi:3-oxoacyl-[acyl-carrier protein] reductase
LNQTDARPRSPSDTAVEQLLEEVEAETEPRAQMVAGGLRGKAAIVTGGSSGIGRAVAVALARSGVHVAFNYLDRGEESRREADRTANEVERCGVRVMHRAMDATVPERVNHFVDEVLEQFGGVHILVNNAGIARDAALWRLSDEDWNQVLATNLSAAFWFIRAVAPHFRAHESGKIVNVASVHARRSEFGLANYAASKAGLVALTRSAALELGPSNVNVNAVAPGYIRTTRLTDGVPSEILDQAREQSALRRLGDPQDVAGAVLFLCSEAARHMTGVVLPVDGGYLL